MNSKYGVLCYRVVTPGQADVDKIEFPKISETVRQVIRETKIKSLQGLLGDDWQKIARDLAKEYWGIK